MARTPDLFKTSASQTVYRKLIASIETLGPVTIEEKKTSLHLTHRRAFAGVHPRSKGIVLNLVFDAPLRNERVHKSEQVSANRYHVEFRLDDPKQIDRQLVGW